MAGFIVVVVVVVVIGAVLAVVGSTIGVGTIVDAVPSAGAVLIVDIVADGAKAPPDISR